MAFLHMRHKSGIRKPVLCLGLSLLMVFLLKFSVLAFENRESASVEAVHVLVNESLNQDVQAGDIFIDGSLAYVASGSDGLRIFDIAHPDRPIQLSLLELDGQVSAVYVKNDHAYVGVYLNGLSIVDISDPTVPFQLSFTEVSGWIAKIVVRDNVAYVADLDNGLRIMDVSDGTNPSEIALIGNEDV